MDRGELACRVHEAAHLVGNFTLSSGVESAHYFDKYQLTSDPTLLAEIAQAMLPLVDPDIQLLAGLEMGAIPLAAALSRLTHLRTVFVRKRRKKYGTRKLAEGPDIDGKRLLIVEDVVSSGGQIAAAADALRQDGAQVEHAIAILDRETGATERLEGIGIRFLALFTATELAAAVHEADGPGTIR